MKHLSKFERLKQEFCYICSRVTLEMVFVAIMLWAAGCYALAGIYQGAFTP